MGAEPKGQITEADARHLGEKLAAFELTLSPPQQTLLRTVLQRAAVIGADIDEYLMLDRLVRIAIGDGGRDGRYVGSRRQGS